MAVRDVKDILEARRGEDSQEAPTATLREQLLSGTQGKKPKKRASSANVPEGTNREVKALREGEGVQKLLPDIEIDSGLGYKQMKAKLGIQKVSAWKWTPFVNPARTDQAVLHHWARAGEEGKQYHYAKFNQSVRLPRYSEEEYKMHLEDTEWSLEETAHLWELCDQFDLRFIVMKDRYDTARFPSRSVEDLKDRYYTVCNRLAKLRAVPGEDLSESLVAYDLRHEKLRKEQLQLLFSRTQEEIEEHDYLVDEVRRVEYRRKERERISHTAQKLIEKVEITDEKGPAEKARRGSASKKRDKSRRERDRDRERGSLTKQLSRITEERGAGPYLRSYRLKVPNTMTNKRAKAMDQMLDELGIGSKPIATENVTKQFNVLRNNILLLFELKSALQAAEFELGSLKLKCDSLPDFSEQSMDEGEASGSGQMQGSSRSSTPTTRKRKGTASSQDMPKKNKVISTPD